MYTQTCGSVDVCVVLSVVELLLIKISHHSLVFDIFSTLCICPVSVLYLPFTCIGYFPLFMYLPCFGAICIIYVYLIFFQIYVFAQFGCNMKWNWQIHQFVVQQHLAYMTERAHTHTHTHTNKHTCIHAHTTICNVMQVIDIYFTIYRQKLWILRVVKLDDFWDVPRTGSFRASWKGAPVLRKKRILNDVEGPSEITKRFEYHETTNCKGIR